jgi:phosphoglycolate phosphatase-like HAD superfamily hydrolase
MTTIASSTGRRSVLVLDFDGVLCDSIDECVIVAHIVHAGLPPEAFGDPGLAGVPLDVRERFRSCRPFMRHLGHFLVPLVAPEAPIDRASFAARFEQLAPADVEAFVERAGAVRRSVRATHETAWLARHRVEPGPAARAAGAYIATARDAASVQRILAAHGVAIDARRIFGDLRSKVAAMRSIAARHGVPDRAVRLVDDSIENCIDVQAAGFDARWASWGYHAPGDADAARAHDIPALGIGDLGEISAEPCHTAVRLDVLQA